MKSLDGSTPLSREIHNLMYRKRTEIWELQNQPVTPFHELQIKRAQLTKLEKKFARQVAWEKIKKGKT